MNYNVGCYRQPTPTGCRPGMRRNERIPLRNIQTPNYNLSATCETNYKLAMVYSPYQEWQNIYSGEKAMEAGTIFAELDKPFLGYKCGGGACSL